MREFQFNVNAEGLVKALGKVIFTNPDHAIRELIQNAQDACIQRQLKDPGFHNPHIEIQTDDTTVTISVADNGIGMTEDDLTRYLATIGETSKRVEQDFPVTGDKYLIGGSGIGTVAMLIVAERLEVITKSFKHGSQALRFTYSGGNTYQLEPIAHSEPGTRVILHMKQQYRDLVSESHLVDVVASFRPHIVVPISINGHPLDFGHPQGFSTRKKTLATEPWDESQSPHELQDHRKAMIRFELAGRWSVLDLASLLNDLQMAYIRLSAFLLLTEGDAQLLRIATRPYVLTVKMHTDFDPLMRIVAERTHELRLSKIEIASPGFAELLGSLNPLKIVADFITAWRHENTLRETAIVEANLELRKTLADRAAALIQAAPSPDFVDRFLRFALDEPRERLEVVARDLRLTAVSLREVSLAPATAGTSSDNAATDEKS